jgi:uncharacterized protein YndB with AHSA1/START domain
VNTNGTRGVDDTRLSLERVMPVSAEDLFDLWTDPTEVARWWAPDGYGCVVDVLDTRPGGRWRIVLQRPDGTSIAISGLYRSVDRPRSLIFTWAWEGYDGERGRETEVRVTFEPVVGGTRLVLEQQPFENSQARDRHHFGWSACLDHIAKLCANT